MSSKIYKRLVNMIRVRREAIDHEIEYRNFESFISPTEIMCTTWFIRGQVEKMHKDLDDAYWYNNTELTRREYKGLDNFIDKLEDYYWSLLYDKSSEIREKLMEV